MPQPSCWDKGHLYCQRSCSSCFKENVSFHTNLCYVHALKRYLLFLLNDWGCTFPDVSLSSYISLLYVWIIPSLVFVRVFIGVSVVLAVGYSSGLLPLSHHGNSAVVLFVVHMSSLYGVKGFTLHFFPLFFLLSISTTFFFLPPSLPPFLFFGGPHLQHMEVPRLGVKSELQLPAYTTATATWDPSCVWDLHGSSRQHQFTPLSEARDQTLLLVDTGQVLNPGRKLLCYIFICYLTLFLFLWHQEFYILETKM